LAVVADCEWRSVVSANVDDSEVVGILKLVVDSDAEATVVSNDSVRADCGSDVVPATGTEVIDDDAVDFVLPDVCVLSDSLVTTCWN